MTDRIHLLAQLDALLATHRCRLTRRERDGGYLVDLGGAARDALIAGLVRLIVGGPVEVIARPATGGPGRCRYCGVDVWWVQSAATEKKIPLDRRPVQIVDAFGRVHRGREAHQSTCPERARVLGAHAQQEHRALLAKGKGGSDGETTPGSTGDVSAGGAAGGDPGE